METIQRKRDERENDDEEEKLGNKQERERESKKRRQERIRENICERGKGGKIKGKRDERRKLQLKCKEYKLEIMKEERRGKRREGNGGRIREKERKNDKDKKKLR